MQILNFSFTLSYTSTKCHKNIWLKYHLFLFSESRNRSENPGENCHGITKGGLSLERKSVDLKRIHIFLKISAGFIRAVRLPMARLARTPAAKDNAREMAIRPVETLTGS